MDRHWNHIIESFSSTFLPKNIVIIGNFAEHITEKLHSYCAMHDAQLHIIDPQLHSLNDLDSIDVICINGDEHWHTISRDLLLLQENIAPKKHFPLVIAFTTNNQEAMELRGQDLNHLQKKYAFVKESLLILRENYALQSHDYIACRSQYENFQKMLSPLQEKIESSNQLLEKCTIEYEELQRAFSELSAENTHLQKAMSDLSAENTRLQWFLEHILHTISWKSTHILRVIGSLLNKFHIK